jgi:alpha-N-arabinofuranosidase
MQGNWTEAPHLTEEMYNLEDALVVGQWLNVFLRKSHVLKIACVAQIVNVISWLHTRGDDLLKQPSFYVFALMSNHARGQALDALVRAPRIATKKYGDVPVLDVSASYDPATGKEAIFIVNRSQTDSVLTDIAWQDGRTVTMDEAWQLAGSDPKALNTWENRNALTAQPITAPRVVDGKATIQLPPLSFTVLTAHAA